LNVCGPEDQMVSLLPYPACYL